VKEDIISRFGELGVIVTNGEIHFKTDLMNADEFLTEERDFKFINVNGGQDSITLQSGSFGFTYCQVPVVYIKSDSEKITVYQSNNEIIEIDDMKLSIELSKAVFNREGSVKKIEVSVDVQS
jgi:hypothetical protein